MSEQLDDLPESKYRDGDESQDKFGKGATFLPRVEFKSDQATICKTREFPSNNYAFITGKGVEGRHVLGETFDALVLDYRYKAIDFRDMKNIKTYYDPDDAEFEKVRIESETKKPPGEKNPCMAGAEFLLYIPGRGYGTLLCSTGSLKVVAKILFKHRRKVVTFGSNLVRGKFTYQAPNVKTADAGVTVDLGTDRATVAKTVKDFIDASGVQTNVEAEDLAEAVGGKQEVEDTPVETTARGRKR